MKQSLSSIVSKLVETREQQQDESDGSNQCGRPSKANNPRLSRSFKLLSRRSSSADSLAGDVLCLSSSSRASDTAPSIGKPNDPSGIESSVKFNSKSQVSLELSLSGTVIETIVESDAKSSSAAATAAGPSSSPIIEQILRIGTIDVSFCSKSDKYTSSTERNSVVSLDFVKESLRPAGNVKNTVSQALQEIVDIKIRDVKILFSVPTLVIIIRSVAQLKRLAVCFKDGVNVSATILSSSSSSDKIASSAEVASASEPYDQALLGEAGSLPPPVKPKASQIKVKVFINKIDVDVRLPFGVALRAVVKNSKIDLAIAAEFDEQRESRQAQIEFESVLVTVPVKTNTVSAPLAFTRTPNESDIIKWENLVLIQTLRTSIIKKSNQRENGTFWLQNCFHVSSSSFLFTIPYAFEMANVVEAAVATNKTLRIILNKHLQIPLSQIPDSGHTVVNHEKIPILKLEVHSLCVKFYDDPFESYLSRNW